ncbi:transposase IS116/IS110/IS902 family protein, partial [Arthrobacter sp. Hiyo6]
VRHLTRMQLIRTLAAWRPDVSNATDPVTAYRVSMKSLARRYLELTDEIADLDELINPIVEALAPELLERVGIGIEVAGQFLVTAGDNPDRMKSEAAFAMLCGVSPLPASSVMTQRHRLNRGGDRQANRALHLAVISRIRLHPRTQAYVATKNRQGTLQDGDHPLPEAIPCPRGLLHPQPRPPAHRPEHQTTSNRRLTLRRASAARSSGPAASLNRSATTGSPDRWAGSARARTTPQWNRSSRCCKRTSWTASGGTPGRNCAPPSRPGSKGPTTAGGGKDGWENSRPSNMKQSTGPRSQRPKTPSQQKPGQSLPLPAVAPSRPVPVNQLGVRVSTVRSALPDAAANIAGLM